MNGGKTATRTDPMANGSDSRPPAGRPLDVRLIAIGTHGDVLPMLALGRELRARGHDVGILANGYHSDLVRRESFEFFEVGTTEIYREYVDHPDIFHPIRGMRVLARLFLQVTEVIYQHLVERNTPGRTVTAGSSLAFPALIARETLGIPTATVSLQPALLFSADDPPALSPRLWWIKRAPRWCGRLSNHLISRYMERSLGAPIREFREKLGLPPWKNFIEWTFSPDAVVGLFPEWFAPRQADWPAHFRHAEFPLFGGDESLPDEVEAFLADGPPPVVFTAGSALTAKPFVQAAADACRRLRLRGIILGSCGEEIGDLPPGVRQWGFVPLGPLLGRAAALVHHGGIGTLSQGLRAGIPQVVTPQTADQPDNAVRAVNLGVARRLNMQDVNGPRLAAALDRVLRSADVAAACRRYAALIPKKPSLEVACRAIEELVPARTAT